MLNQKQDADSVASQKNLNTQRKSKIEGVPDENDEQHDTYVTSISEEKSQENEVIFLSSKGMKSYMDGINNPPEPNAKLIKELKNYREATM